MPAKSFIIRRAGKALRCRLPRRWRFICRTFVTKRTVLRSALIAKNAENRSSVPNLMKLRNRRRAQKALLNYFGSAEAVAQAGLKDIEDVPGISKNGGKKYLSTFLK